MRFVIFVLVALAAAQAQPANVEGRVHTPEGDPVPKALVRLHGSGERGVQPRTYVEISGLDGTFHMENVQPDSYVLSAQVSGFVPPMPSINSQQSAQIKVTAGEKRQGLEIVLTPLGIVGGTVLDPDGSPVVGAQVGLVRMGFSQGRMTPSSSGGVSTDDRGQFRISNIPPGRYYVRATPGNAPYRFAPDDIRGPSALELTFATYSPDSAGIEGATRYNVGPKPIENIQIRMRHGRSHTLRGRIEGARGKIPALSLIPSDADGASSDISANVLPAGQFEVTGVPGNYTLVARYIDGSGVDARSRSARLQVTVADADLANLVLRMAEGFDVTGRLRLDDGREWAKFMTPPPPPGVLTLKENAPKAPGTASLSLQPVDESSTSSPRVIMNEDGTFVLRDVEAGKYLVNLTGLPDDAYIQSITLAGRDLTHQPLELAAEGALEIAVSAKIGILHAKWPSQLLEGKGNDTNVVITVWPVVPDRSRPASGVMAAQLNRQQQTELDPLPPGDYYAAVFEEVPVRGLLGIPEFLARFNSMATRVTLQEGSNTVDPAVIPAAAVKQIYDEIP